jgi:hypothetical protein
MRAAPVRGQKQQPPIVAPPVATGSTDIVIDVIIAYTKKAAANYTDIKSELIDLSIEEGNESFRMSGLGNIKLRLVHAYQTDYVEEGAHFDHVWRFADKGDGYMDEIHGPARQAPRRRRRAHRRRPPGLRPCHARIRRRRGGVRRRASTIAPP